MTKNLNMKNEHYIPEQEQQNLSSAVELHSQSGAHFINSKAFSEHSKVASLTEITSLPDTIKLRPAKNQKIGEYFLSNKTLSQDQINIALFEQKKSGGFIGQILIKLGFLQAFQITEALSNLSGLATANIKAEYNLNFLDIDVNDFFTLKQQQCCNAVFYKIESQNIFIAITDPFDLAVKDKIKQYLPKNYSVIFTLTTSDEISEFFNQPNLEDKNLQNLKSSLKNLSLANNQGFAENSSQEKIHPIIGLVQQILNEAVASGASDIHFEPEENSIRVRFRIDGALKQMHALHKEFWGPISHRIKILSNMNIAETRHIQDGRFKFTYLNKEIDVRAAIMPTQNGETIVLRLLDNQKTLFNLEELGFNHATQIQLEQLINKPNGLTLITGPTGSGKSTTTYAFLRKIQNETVHISALEDPVEYRLDEIRQTSIDNEQGLTFANALRGTLRMDPDIIFIGEIRDQDTAQMALRAALTGHKVYSTLHCLDSFSAFSRLQELGISSRSLVGNLAGIMAQRLVRKLCPFCKSPRLATEKENSLLRQPSNARTNIFDPIGCHKCLDIGRKGRLAVAEVFTINDQIEDLILQNASRNEFMAASKELGFKTIQEQGIELVLGGIVALQDLQKVIDLSRGF